ncbi:MAG TPA: YoaK family protein [Actinomycetota bacterium]|nr:YoaK family protein [Actinomycetota bacterium]
MRTALQDARRIVAPRRDDPDGPLPQLLLGLTVVTGFVDAYSYLALGHVFVANMTGNVVFLGFALAGAKGFSVAASLLALGAFALGAVWGGRLGARSGRSRTRLLAVAVAVEAALVGASLIVAVTAAAPGSGWARFVLIALLGLTMGGQNAVARKLAVPDLTTTVLTLTITGMFADGRPAGGTSSKVGRRILSPIAMFGGAILGALLILHVASWLSIGVALAILCLVAARAGLHARRTEP